MTTARSFVVATFSADNFLDSLAIPPCTSFDVSQGDASAYLIAYLATIGVKTIVTELDYVDADYLDDYANFYAKSFEGISNRCRRLHFLKLDIKDDAAFLEYVRGERPPNELQDNYAGFVVARPLPTAAAIGRTAVATYPPDGRRRNYPTVRRYEVSLFGIDLFIDSLAFQVQDTSLAACATVALWSCFQKTQELFKSLSPTPVAITRAANRYLLATRPFPSRGLQVHQICNAIASVGLDPEVYGVNASLPLASLIYSYLHLGLPVLLLVKIPGVGGHAIALTGYSIRDTEQLTSEGGGVGTVLPKMVGTRIDEFYGHDDQKGPFCRLPMVAPKDPDGVVTFKSTGWSADLIPEAVIVPIYPKVRTGFREVQKSLPVISSLVAAGGANAAQFEWDVFLTSGNEFKKVLREEDLYSKCALRESLLLEGFPKYLWRCILRVGGNPHLEMVLDTTAMVEGFAILHLLWHDDSGRQSVGAVIAAHESTLIARFGPRLVSKVKSSI